jgi:hypothetical protein
MPDPAKALQMLDRMEEFFDGGKRWTRNKWHDGRGHYCLIGALNHLSKADRPTRKQTRSYLEMALPAPHRVILRYNDWASSYLRIQILIARARALAEHDLAKRQSDQVHAEVPALPLVVLKYLKSETLAHLPAAEPGLAHAIDAIERERKQRAVIQALKKSMKAARELEPV